MQPLVFIILVWSFLIRRRKYAK